MIASIEENLVTELLGIYDVVFERPQSLEDCAMNLATGLWNELNGHDPAKFTPFLPGFKAFYRTG